MQRFNLMVHMLEMGGGDGRNLRYSPVMIEPFFEHLRDEQRTLVELLLGDHQPAFGEANVQPLAHDCLFVTHLREDKKN